MAVNSALVYRKLLEENRTLKRQLGSTVSLGDWVGCTPEFQEVRRSIATAALATGTVLLAGEDGTGRRLAAELLHRHGRNPGSTFLPMDLESLPKGELRRLLNEVREAADTGRDSYVHGARPGTLYLAELTALVPEDQAALKEFLGETVPFRLMASADPALLPKLGQRRFDPETFDATSKITIEIPALRERRGDIPVLIDHFLKRFRERLKLKPLGIPSSAHRQLLELRLARQCRGAFHDDRKGRFHRLRSQVRWHHAARALLRASVLDRSGAESAEKRFTPRSHRRHRKAYHRADP